MSKLDITDSQSKILDKVYDRAHDVLYEGVSATSQASYMPANAAYKSVIDSPPSGVNPGDITTNTKDGTRTAAAAIVAHVTPTIHVIRSTATKIVSLASPGILMSSAKLFNSKQRRVLFIFNGYATASTAAPLIIYPYIAPLPVGTPFTFTVSTTGTNIYGHWEVVLPDLETVTVGIYVSTPDLTANITLAQASNQVVTIYG
jgi:hypothetical protein